MSESDSTSPSLPQSPSLLQSLRQRSAAVHDAHSAPRPHAPDRRAIDRSLLAAFRWLDEALGHLAVIRPVVAHQFALAGLLTIATPRYDRGFASYRRTSIGGFELIERIELYYRMANDEPIRLEVQPAAAFATEERLRSAQLDYRYMIEHPDWLPPQGKAELMKYYRDGQQMGRIYRVYPKDKTPRAIPNLATMNTKELVAALENPSGWVRDKAQQMLIRKNDAAFRRSSSGPGRPASSPGSS
jgi:hypothetical protein